MIDIHSFLTTTLCAIKTSWWDNAYVLEIRAHRGRLSCPETTYSDYVRDNVLMSYEGLGRAKLRLFNKFCFKKKFRLGDHIRKAGLNGEVKIFKMLYRLYPEMFSIKNKTFENFLIRCYAGFKFKRDYLRSVNKDKQIFNFLLENNIVTHEDLEKILVTQKIYKIVGDDLNTFFTVYSKHYSTHPECFSLKSKYFRKLVKQACKNNKYVWLTKVAELGLVTPKQIRGIYKKNKIIQPFIDSEASYYLVYKDKDDNGPCEMEYVGWKFKFTTPNEITRKVMLSFDKKEQIKIIEGYLLDNFPKHIADNHIKFVREVLELYGCWLSYGKKWRNQ